MDLYEGCGELVFVVDWWCLGVEVVMRMCGCFVYVDG